MRVAMQRQAKKPGEWTPPWSRRHLSRPVLLILRTLHACTSPGLIWQTINLLCRVPSTRGMLRAISRTIRNDECMGRTSRSPAR
ncbi:hypothetical protein K456DRAFT_53157 [Colletotrichum gloeosporioides 23]|nr:hypothetical protein K456DRAFT_53157 [Colletotrichum gloeosporioides 23]